MNHRRRPFLYVPLVGVALLSTMSAAPAADVAPAGTAARTSSVARADLGMRLDQILDDPRLVDSQVGVTVREAASGQSLYDRDANRRMIPASNNKVFTSAAALDILGPDFRFATSVGADGSQRGTVLAGNVYLKGTGDPTTLANDYDDLAAKVAASGIEVVTGGLVADDTAFDRVRLGTEWGWDDEPYYYTPQTSALTVSSDTDYNPGTVLVQARPAVPGEPAELNVVPETRYVTLLNRTTTGAPGSDTAIRVEREHGTNDIVVSGSVPAGGDVHSDYASVWDPTGYAASVFRDALLRHGVLVLGRTSTGATPAEVRPLGEHQSMSLTEMLVPFLKLSNNGHAEALTKAMGRMVFGEGSWDAGLRATAESLTRLGVDTGGIQRVDGSGLSRQDLLSAMQLSNLYRGVAGRPWFPAWYEALPIAGAPDRLAGGTLRYRMRDTPAANNLHGKTGSLTGVSTLTGYVKDSDGRQLIFAIMLNNQLSYVEDIEDDIGVALASYSDNRPSGANRPAPPPVIPAPNVRSQLATHECTWIRLC